MRSDKVFLEMQCNQACVYCNSRWSRPEPAWSTPHAVAKRIQAAVDRGGEELVFTGGEPTLRDDLPSLIQLGKRLGAKRVVLETNGTLINRRRARALAAAGLDLARVNLSAPEAVLDTVTRDPGGFARTIRGIGALKRAGIGVQVSAALVAKTREHLAELPSLLCDVLDGASNFDGIWLNVPYEGPDEDELLAPSEMLKPIGQIDRKARGLGVTLRLNPEGPIRPCMFESVGRIAHLFTMTPGARKQPGHTKVAPCESCLMNDRCVGLPNRIAADPPPLKPIVTERARRQLSLISTVKEQIDLEYLARDTRRSPQGGEVKEYIIRANFSCNQACRFCFVSTHLPAQQDEKIIRAIEEAGEVGARVTFSGGEPTLNPRLSEYVALAKKRTEKTVEMQTNATRLADPKKVDALVDAGLDEVLVSLHASDAELSDAITEAPGTFVQTVAGIDALVGRVPKVTLHCVISARNAAELVTWVRWVADRWPSVYVNFSFVGLMSDVIPRDHDLLPRYTDVLPELEEALVEAQKRDLAVGRFHSMCGIPLCLAPTVTKTYLTLTDIDPELSDGEFVKPPPCGECELSSKCFGIRRGYDDLYGFEELNPITRAQMAQWANSMDLPLQSST